MKVVKEPTPSVIVQRFKFNTCSQRPGEFISSFVAELRRLAEHCNYTDTLEDTLRDRLVCGILDERLQPWLLVEPNLKLKALEILQAAEMAEQGA